jgi:hypothetical protein
MSLVKLETSGFFVKYNASGNEAKDILNKNVAC